MASNQDRQEAFDMFIQQVGAPDDIARDLAAFLEARYKNQLVFSEREALFDAVNWAAIRIRSTFDVSRLTRNDFDLIAQSLIHGCPLCASSTPRSSWTPPVSSSQVGG
jgi:hypothetical protein